MKEENQAKKIQYYDHIKDKIQSHFDNQILVNTLKVAESSAATYTSIAAKNVDNFLQKIRKVITSEMQKEEILEIIKKITNVTSDDANIYLDIVCKHQPVVSNDKITTFGSKQHQIDQMYQEYVISGKMIKKDFVTFLVTTLEITKNNANVCISRSVKKFS
jgi:DNA-binding cell septation regulator SpoVG